MNFNFEANKYKELLQAEMNWLDEAISNSPPGRLKINRNGTRFKWINQLDSGERQYIRKKDVKQAGLLAAKSYYKRKRVETKQELMALDYYLNNHNRIRFISNDLENGDGELSRLIGIGKEIFRMERFEMSPSVKRRKKNGFSFTADEKKISAELKAWMEEEYPTNRGFEESLNVKAVGGLMVRSKSEAFIANELSARGIPFRYECLLEIDGAAYYPDFTIIHPISNEKFYWEHLGLMDDAEYREKAKRKLVNYTRAGVIPGINLIITYETEYTPLDFGVVKKLIDAYFG